MQCKGSRRDRGKDGWVDTAGTSGAAGVGGVPAAHAGAGAGTGAESGKPLVPRGGRSRLLDGTVGGCLNGASARGAGGSGTVGKPWCLGGAGAIGISQDARPLCACSRAGEGRTEGGGAACRCLPVA
jgi:hypothetical protein